MENKSYEIKGKIIAVLDAKSGTSAATGKDWTSQEYVIETIGQHPAKCCFRVFGEEKIASLGIKLGETLTVCVDINAREYNGRWFNDITAWRVIRQEEKHQGGMSFKPQTEEDDLPFFK